jgi:hypothetical protein
MLAKWGQSLTKVFLTFEISDNDVFSYQVEGNRIKVLSNGNDLSFELSALVSKFRVVIEHKNKVILEFIKSEPEEWFRLCNDKLKRTWLTIDWNHWILEEEEKTDMMDPNMMNMMDPNMMNNEDDNEDDNEQDNEDESEEDNEKYNKEDESEEDNDE